MPARAYVRLRPLNATEATKHLQPSSPITAADNTVEITGSYGDLAGPALVSVVADDADDGDAILGAGDTLTLTFDVSTDRGLGAVGKRAHGEHCEGNVRDAEAPGAAHRANGSHAHTRVKRHCRS